MGLVNSRSEIIFLYDTTDMNPNGDPMDENKPRIDEEVGINIVTDVRLKRTIRDYLAYYEKQDVFILPVKDEKGNIKTKDERLKKYKNDPELLKTCVDVRMFGVTAAVKDGVITYTGPVQFKFGRSMHRVDMKYIKGTTIIPAKKDSRQGTFTEKYILPYSLICFYGVVNENLARVQDLNLKNEDIEFLLKGMWNGTKNLMSNSKMGQMPRVLLQVVYKEKNFQIGELEKRIKLKKYKQDESIRDIEDVSVDITKFIDVINKYQDVIEKIKYKVDDRVSFIYKDEKKEFDEILTYIDVKTSILKV